MESEETKEGQEQSTQQQQGSQEQSTTPDRYTELLAQANEGEQKEEKKEETDEEIEIEQEAKDKLTELGYKDEDLKTLKPEEIQKIIDEDKKKEVSDEEQISYAEDKLIFEKGTEKKELSKIDLGDGNFAFVPEHLKDGLLRQNDYTKKTMALADERRNFETQKQSLTQLQEELYKLNYIDYLGQPFQVQEPEEPLRRDFIEDLDKYETKADAEEAYEKAKKEWKKHKEEYDKKKKEYDEDVSALKNVTQSVLNENNKMVDEFEKKYGKEALETTFKKAQSYINPHVFKGTVAFPKDALELIYKGMKYDEDIKKVQKDTEIKTVKTLNDKHKTVIKITKGKEIKKDDSFIKNLPERYNFMKDIPK